MTLSECAFHDLMFEIATLNKPGLPNGSTYGWLADKRGHNCAILRGVSRSIHAVPEVQEKLQAYIRAVQSDAEAKNASPGR